jgi:hypothetical protein
MRTASRGRPAQREAVQEIKLMLPENGPVRNDRWRRVTSQDPCRVCGKTDYCTVSPDGQIALCRRVEAGAWKTKTDRAGATYFLHKLGPAESPPSCPTEPPQPGAGLEQADPDTLHKVYSALLAALPLTNAHRDALGQRGLHDDAINTRGYGSLPVRGRGRVASTLRERFGDAVLRVPGFITREREGRRYLTLAGNAGLIVPVRDTGGRVVALLTRKDEDGKGPKYTYLSSSKFGGPGPGSPVHVPLGVTAPAAVVRVTEGVLKADVAFAISGVPTIGIPGVNNWRSALPALRDLGAVAARLALDADAADNPAVARALAAVAAGLRADSRTIEHERWPAGHKGIDDALAAGVVPEVLTGTDAAAAIDEVVAEGIAGEPPQEPGPLDSLAAILADGGAEELFRNKQILQALARLAQTDPAEYVVHRAKLARAGVRLRDLEMALAPLRREERAAQPPPDAAEQYRIAGGRIVRETMTQQGPAEIPLANWSGRIVEQVTIDAGDGDEERVLAIEGELQDGTPLPRVEVTTEEFTAMRWPLERWGAQAVTFAGQGTADHLRTALQLLSGEIPRRTTYRHTGWARLDNKEWAYLHAGGAIGPDGPVAGVSVALPAPLARYVLPEPPRGEALVRAIRSSLRLIELAPDRVSIPLQGATYRAVLGRSDNTVHLAGPSGNGKTEAATLQQAHFGAEMDARNLPASWSSTGNALEALAYHAKDALMVVDDFAPTGTQADVARMNRDADRLLRAQGNSAGRARLTSETGFRRTRSPRGQILSTGEDIPKGTSLRGRMLALEISPGDLELARLTPYQQDAAAGLYAEAMAGYLQYLAPRYDQIRAGLREEVAAERAQLQALGAHSRTPTIVADLLVGWHYFLDFAQAAGAISPDDRSALDLRVRTALQGAGKDQAAHQAAADPCHQFLRLLAGALSSGRSHCTAPAGGSPDASPEVWGWRTRDESGGDRAAAGRCIGWVDDGDLYLEPEAAYAEAQELARHQGESISLNARTLWKRLHEHGYLASRDENRQRFTIRRPLGGLPRREVLHLRAASLFAPEPSPPSQPSPTPQGDGQDGDGGGPGSGSDRPRQPTANPHVSGGGAAAGDGGDGRDGRGNTPAGPSDRSSPPPTWPNGKAVGGRKRTPL